MTSKRAENFITDHSIAPDVEIGKIVTEAKKASGQTGGRVIGRIAKTLESKADHAGEASLGHVIADAQWEATKSLGADLALTNLTGVRGDLVGDANGIVTYANAFATQPFNNVLITMTLTGADFLALMEEQLDRGPAMILAPSAELHYAYTAERPSGSRLDVDSLRLHGKPIDRAKRYRVTVNNFLSSGGDGLAALARGTDEQEGPSDMEALVAYFATHKLVQPPPKGRVTRH